MSINTTPSKAKIKDIAVKAGVSPGTIDRVLHNRGNVSEATKKKVENILEEINYTPNLYASALASKRVITLLAVIPTHEPGEYWEMIETGIQRGAKEFIDFKVRVLTFYFSQYNVESFCKVMEEAIAIFPDGILLAPSMQSATFDFCCKMDRLNIIYAFIDSHIEKTKSITYYGQNSHQSGYLGAKLLLMQKPDIQEIAVFSFYHVGQIPSNQISRRMAGFSSYILKNKSNCTLRHTTLEVDNSEKNAAEMHQLFFRNPNIEGAVIFSSRSYVVAEFLKKYELDHITLIGYDLLEKNVQYLKNDTISFLIAQRPQEQGYKGIKTLCDYLLFKKQVNKINYTPIDILTRENIDFYSEF